MDLLKQISTERSVQEIGTVSVKTYKMRDWEYKGNTRSKGRVRRGRGDNGPNKDA